MQVPGLDTVGHHVREAAKFAPERPAIWLGLRTAAATAIPLLIARWIDPVAAGWAPLAGFIVAVVDKGGAYRTRAAVMGSVAIGGLLAVLLGSLIAGHGMFTAIPVAVGLTLCALTQAFGPAMVSAGETVAIQLLVAASLPCTPEEALQRTIGFAWGAGFAMLLGLIVWPIRVYKPGRNAVSAVYGALARYVRALADDLGPESDSEWRARAVSKHRAIRDQIETARQVLAATRRGRRGETGRGERLLALVQLADQVFGVVSGLEESLDAGTTHALQSQVREGLYVLADGLAELATNVPIERAPSAVTPAWSASPPKDGSAVERALGAHSLALLNRAHENRMAAARVLATVYDDSEPLNAVVPDADPQPTLRERLHDAFDPHGMIGRHALRVAFAVTFAMALARGLELSHRYWVTLTAFLLLQPQGAATRVLAVQRVAGTLVGAVLAALIPWVVDDPGVLVAMVIILAGVSASVVRINYALHAMFLTPTFISLAEIHAHDPSMIGTRIANTALGAGIAIAASLAWHIRPSRQFDDQLAEAYVATRGYLDAVVAAIIGSVPPGSSEVLRARRAAGVEVNRCEVALEQLLAERTSPSVIEPRMEQIVSLRRLAAGINAFGSTRGITTYGSHQIEIATFAASMSATLGTLADAMRGEQALAARPRVDRVASEPVLAARFARIDRSIVALVDAALRSQRTA